MRVIHDPPYRPTKGKFCIVGGRPVNKGLACCKCLVQNEALNGGRRSPGVAVGGVAELSRRSSGLFHGSGYSDSTIQRICFGRVPQKCYGPKRSRNGLVGSVGQPYPPVESMLCVDRYWDGDPDIGCAITTD